jgi:putative lipoic acid-binding regulatory protein
MYVKLGLENFKGKKMTEEETKKPEIEFPCYFPLKAIGNDVENYRDFVVRVVGQHCDSIQEERITTRLSNGGKYIAVTVPFTAISRQQLDTIYQQLSDDPHTVYLL